MKALLIIDVQKGFDDPSWGKRNNFYAEDNIKKLLNAFREKKHLVYHVKHDSVNKQSPLYSSKSGNDIKDIVKPIGNEPVFTKNVNSAFIGTTLYETLKKDKVDTLVIVGLTTDHCVSTTARMAGNLGFNVYVVSDATATFDRNGFNKKHYSAKTMHEIALVSLQDEFATILDTESLLSTISMNRNMP